MAVLATPRTRQRLIWIGGISLANAGAAGIVGARVAQDAAGAGWGVVAESATVATLALSLGGLWWGTRRQPRLRTGVGIGLAIGVLVHPVMWYLALLVGFVSDTRGSLGEPGLNPVDSLSAVWLYSFFSLLFTGWLSCPISAAICGAGLALYARRPATK